MNRIMFEMRMRAHLKPKINQRISNEGFGRMIGAARIERRESDGANFAADTRIGTVCQDKILRREKHDGRIAMLMGWYIRAWMIAVRSNVVIIRMSVMVMVIVMRVAGSAAKAHVACKRIGEMRMMMRMVQLIL